MVCSCAKLCPLLASSIHVQPSADATCQGLSYPSLVLHTHTGTPGVPPSNWLVWYEAVVQITTTLLGELMGRFLQAKFFDTDVPWCWAQVCEGVGGGDHGRVQRGGDMR